MSAAARRRIRSGPVLRMRTVALAAAMAFAATGVPAQTAPQAQAAKPEVSGESLELGRELARLTEARRQLLGMMPPVAFSLRQIMTAANPKAATAFDEALPIVVSKIMNRAESFEELVAGIYARHFSKDELGELVAFYKSTPGRKLVQLQPAMMEDLAKASQPIEQEIRRQLADDMRKELRKRGYGI